MRRQAPRDTDFNACTRQIPGSLTGVASTTPNILLNSESISFYCRGNLRRESSSPMELTRPAVRCLCIRKWHSRARSTLAKFVTRYIYSYVKLLTVQTGARRLQRQLGGEQLSIVGQSFPRNFQQREDLSLFDFMYGRLATVLDQTTGPFFSPQKRVYVYCLVRLNVNFQTGIGRALSPHFGPVEDRVFMSFLHFFIGFWHSFLTRCVHLLEHLWTHWMVETGE